MEPTIPESEEIEEEEMAAEPSICNLGQQGSYLDAMKQSEGVMFYNSQTPNEQRYNNPMTGQNTLATDFQSIVLNPTNDMTELQPNTYNLQVYSSAPTSFSNVSVVQNNTFPKPTVVGDQSLTTIQQQQLPVMSSEQSTQPQVQVFVNTVTSKPQIITPHNKVTANNTGKPSTSGTSTKPKPSSRKNAWGNMSYADLITQAIESSPEKRLTLAQIYDWMVKNVNYFKDKGDSNSSAGWKNSIRHNLSLHSKFKRTQNEGTGKSSWWTINYDAKPGKSPRRPRASSLDPSVHKKLMKTSKEAKKKKRMAHIKATEANGDICQLKDPTSWNNEEFMNYRTRKPSSTSSVGPAGPHSPNFYMQKDLDDDGAMLSPSLSNGNLFSLIRKGKDEEYGEDAPSTSGGHLQGFVSMNYDAEALTSPELEATPNLARLLQSGSKNSPSSSASKPLRSKISTNSLDSSMPRSRANTMPRLQPQPKYDMNSPPPSKNVDNKDPYHMQPEQKQQQGMLYNLLSNDETTGKNGVTATAKNTFATSTNPINIQQQQQQQQGSKRQSQQHGGIAAFSFEQPVKYIHTDMHQLDNCLNASRLSSSHQPTSGFSSMLPSLQFSDKIINDTNLNVSTSNGAASNAAGGAASRQEPAAAAAGSGSGTMEMDVLGTDEMLIGDLGMFPMGDSDMHNLLNDIKSTEVESSDMDRYLTDSKNEQLDYEQREQQQQVWVECPAPFNHNGGVVFAEQQQQRQEQPYQQQFHQLEPNRQQQQQQYQPQQQISFQEVFQNPLAMQQQQQQQVQYGDEQLIGSPSAPNNTNSSLPAYDGLGIAMMNGSPDPPMLDSYHQQPKYHHHHYGNMQQQCYQQVIPQQQHLIISQQSAAISSVNYKN